MAIHKCRGCIWSNKINNNLLYCMFPRCVVKESVSEQAAIANESAAVSKTSVKVIKERRSKNVSKKTSKTL